MHNIRSANHPSWCIFHTNEMHPTFASCCVCECVPVSALEWTISVAELPITRFTAVAATVTCPVELWVICICVLRVLKPTF